MIIGIPHESWGDFDFQTGDELAVFDDYGNLTGVSVLKQENNVLVVWGDDPVSNEKDGMIYGEDFNFELWTSSSNKTYNLSFEWKEGQDYFNANGINIVSNIVVEENQINLIEDIHCFPNPSSQDVMLEFNLMSDQDLIVSVFNSIGEKVYKIDNHLYNSGKNKLILSTSHLKQGLYFIQLKSVDIYKNITLEILK